MNTSRFDTEAGFMKKRPQFHFATVIVAVAAALLCLCTLPAFGADGTPVPDDAVMLAVDRR